MAVSTNIKRLREGSNMTQSELADRLGVARSTVTQWENGWSSPRMGMVQKLAGVFRVTTGDIVSDTVEQPDASADALFERLGRNYSALDLEQRQLLVGISDLLVGGVIDSTAT